MADGFAFDFDGDGVAVSNSHDAVNTDDVHEPLELHPLGAQSLAELITNSSECLKGAELGEVPLNEDFPGIRDHELRTVLHVIGSRVDELERAVAAADADGEDASGERRDIVPGQYLGGLKVWSCAVDMAKAVYTAGASPNVPDVLPAAGTTPLLELYVAMRQAMGAAGAQVLELGCGHGLPGIAALACGATDVSFHDFNHQVIERCLLPNLCATFGDNLRSMVVMRRQRLVPFSPAAAVRAGSGAWQSLAPADPATGAPMLFDCILGADVTYDATATRVYIATVARLLKPGGWAFIGTKVYYFGTGGGVAAIEHEVARHGGALELVLSVPTHTDGDSMPRSILALRRTQ